MRAEGRALPAQPEVAKGPPLEERVKVEEGPVRWTVPGREEPLAEPQIQGEPAIAEPSIAEDGPVA